MSLWFGVLVRRAAVVVGLVFGGSGHRRAAILTLTKASRLGAGFFGVI
jgi:hypothetical protein